MKYFLMLALLSSCSYQAGVAWQWGRGQTIEEKLMEQDAKMRKLSQDLEFNASPSR